MWGQETGPTRPCSVVFTCSVWLNSDVNTGRVLASRASSRVGSYQPARGSLTRINHMRVGAASLALQRRVVDSFGYSIMGQVSITTPRPALMARWAASSSMTPS